MAKFKELKNDIQLFAYEIGVDQELMHLLMYCRNEQDLMGWLPKVTGIAGDKLKKKFMR
jgi:hypothetical protein